ncbi:MAG: hypothetical protein ABSG90_07850 [Dehalococcoidia bacterium]
MQTVFSIITRVIELMAFPDQQLFTGFIIEDFSIHEDANRMVFIEDGLLFRIYDSMVDPSDRQPLAVPLI